MPHTNVHCRCSKENDADSCTLTAPWSPSSKFLPSSSFEVGRSKLFSNREMSAGSLIPRCVRFSKLHMSKPVSPNLRAPQPYFDNALVPDLSLKVFWRDQTAVLEKGNVQRRLCSSPWSEYLLEILLDVYSGAFEFKRAILGLGIPVAGHTLANHDVTRERRYSIG